MKTIELEDWEITELQRIINTAEGALDERIQILDGITDKTDAEKDLIIDMKVRIVHGNSLWQKLQKAALR